MSKASGFVLILAGVAAAAYALPSGTDIGETELLQFTDIAKTFVAGGESQVAAAPEPRPAVRPPPTAAAVEPPPAPSKSAPVVVTIAQRPSEPSLAPALRPAPLLKDRDAIGRELQKELRRVGCYEGELNGVWTTSTRQAMKAFTDRVNATLPTEEPDPILLTLVQAYQDKVCGRPCPAGQGMNETGRCVPSAILARSNKKPAAVASAVAVDPKPAPAITGWSTTTTAAATTPPPAPAGASPTEGRMALAGPATPETAAGTSPPGTPAVTPPAIKPTPRVVRSSDGSWVRNVFRRHDSPN